MELHDPLKQDRTYLRNAGLRKGIVMRMCKQDERVPALVATLDEVIEATLDSDPYTARMAMVVVMRTEGSRRHLKALARSAAGLQREGTFWHFPALASPELGRAVYLCYWYALRPETPLALRDTLNATGDLLVDDPAGGRARVRDGLTRSHGRELRIWIDVATALHPIPQEIARAFVSELTRAEGDDRFALLRLLERAGTKAEWGGEGAGEQIATHLVNAFEGFKGKDRLATVVALGYLGAATPGVLEFLLAQVRGRSWREALDALGQLGPAAAPVAAGLIDHARERPRIAPSIAIALVAMKAPEALPFVGEQLEAAEAKDRREIAKGLADFPGADSLSLTLLAEVGRANVNALETLVRWDLAVADQVTQEALVVALSESQEQRFRKHALRLTKELTAVPDVILEAMIDCLGSEVVASVAVEAVGDLGRFGETALQWKDRMMRLQAEAERRGPPLGVLAAFNVLGEIAGDHPDVRDRLFELLDRYAPAALEDELDADGIRILLGTLRGLGGVEDPTEEQYLTVARLRGTRVRRVKEHPGGGYAYMLTALRVMGKPSWHRVRMAAGIKLAMEPRIREPTWRP